MHTRIKEKIKAMSTDTILLVYSVVSLVVLAFIFFSNPVQGDEILYKFKSPSFSGVNSSSHYLTIENQEATRKQAIKEEIEAYQDELDREQDTITLTVTDESGGTTNITVPIGDFTF